jgi:putative phosphoribosyl transferase
VIAARERQYRGARPPPRLQGRTAVLVDDGLATGSTMRAAIAVAHASGAAAIIVAVPVGPPDTCAALRREVDDLLCLQRPPAFRAVSQWYRHFEQTSDAEVQDLLARAWKAETASAAVPGTHRHPGTVPTVAEHGRQR